MTAAQVAFGQPGGAEEGVAETLRQVIRQAAARAPRSLQQTIGPSEVGVDCDRRLAMRMMARPKVNDGGDPLASIIGTAFHDWVANAFSKPEHGGRWLVEHRLRIAPPWVPGGSCDLYDTVTDDVIDWKVIGETSNKKYRKEGPRQQYQVQAHLYGLGWELAGRRPRTVTLAFVPRSRKLSGLWVWRAPYDRGVAAAALQRIYTLRDLLIAVDPERHPQHWALIPSKPSHGCSFCPYYRPGTADFAQGCPGDLPPTA